MATGSPPSPSHENANPFSDPSEIETERSRDQQPRSEIEQVDGLDFLEYHHRQATLPEHGTLDRIDSFETSVMEGRNNQAQTEGRERTTLNFLNARMDARDQRGPALQRGSEQEHGRRPSLQDTGGRRGSEGSSVNEVEKFSAEQNTSFAAAVEGWLGGKDAGDSEFEMKPDKERREEDMTIDEEMLEFQFEEALGVSEVGDWAGAEEAIESILSNPAAKSEDPRLIGVFIKLLDIHLMQGNWVAVLKWTDRFDREGPQSGPVNLLTASAYWLMGKPSLSKHFCQRAIERSRKVAKYTNTKIEAMALMAEIMDSEGKKVEAKFYRSKLPRNYQSAFEKKQLHVASRTNRKIETQAVSGSLQPPGAAFQASSDTMSMASSSLYYFHGDDGSSQQLNHDEKDFLEDGRRYQLELENRERQARIELREREEQHRLEQEEKERENMEMRARLAELERRESERGTSGQEQLRDRDRERRLYLSRQATTYAQRAFANINSAAANSNVIASQPTSRSAPPPPPPPPPDPPTQETEFPAPPIYTADPPEVPLKDPAIGDGISDVNTAGCMSNDGVHTVEDVIAGRTNPMLPQVSRGPGVDLSPKYVLRKYPVSFDQRTGRLKGRDYNIVSAFESGLKKDKFELANILFLDPDFPLDPVSRKPLRFCGMTPLHFTAKHNKPIYIPILLSRGENINEMTASKKTALLMAAERGYDDTIKVLHQHGADINAVYNKNTALHLAVVNRNVSTVRLLLRLGVDAELKNERRKTAYMLACEGGKSKKEVVDCFKDFWRINNHTLRPPARPPPYEGEPVPSSS